jgi:hypothetical protein
MITAKQIQQVLEKYPSLNYFGFGLFNEDNRKHENNSEKLYQKKLQEQRQELLNAFKQIEYVVNWLSDVDKIKSFNKKRTSYGLKDLAEKNMPNQYISNGSFIVGAIIAGFNIEIVKPNAIFNMSEKSLKNKS